MTPQLTPKARAILARKENRPLSDEDRRAMEEFPRHSLEEARKLHATKTSVVSRSESTHAPDFNFIRWQENDGIA